MERLLIFGLLIFSLSCVDSESELTEISTNSKILIETRELLDDESRNLTFYCKTEKIFPCSNFSILTEKEVNNNSFEITFTSVRKSVICTTSLGPASTMVDLNTVQEGEYQIAMNNGNLKNKGTLSVSETEIKLIFGQQKGIEIVRPTTKRVPQNTYWGTIGYHTSSSVNLVNEFLQKLEDKGAVFNKQAPGHYYYYEIDQNGDIIADTENSGYYFVKAFIFNFDGGESELKNLVRIEGKKYETDLLIRMETFQGEQVNNWSN